MNRTKYELIACCQIGESTIQKIKGILDEETNEDLKVSFKFIDNKLIISFEGDN